ncbi:telomere repeat-binding protein 5-like [Camellia sinensis]|uniref:telomere repeat-binding protein 5-like n=1 Tax=Camellia sinensis TaxID=4442 RepID=UPI0010359331|nr:telomere repeat-binding protein 5-like [Camellia sinensis]
MAKINGGVKRLDYGFNDYQVPPTPRATRSARRRVPFRKNVDDNQICAFYLLATVAGKLLLEGENSPSSGNALTGKELCTIVKDSFKKEQKDEDNPSKAEPCGRGSCDRSFSFSELASHAPALHHSLKEFSHAHIDDCWGLASVITTSDCSENVGSAKKLKSKIQLGSSASKLEVASSGFQESCDFTVGNENKKKIKIESPKAGNALNVTKADICSSDDLAVRDRKPPALVSVNNRVKLPSCIDQIPSSSFPACRDDVKLVIRDDDENSSGCSQPSTTTKTFRSPLCIVFGCSAEKLEPLSWDLRIQIAIDVARALEYLLDGAIEAVSDLKTYLAARLLKRLDFPEMKFSLCFMGYEFRQLLVCIEMEIGLFIRRTLMVALFCLWVPMKVMVRTGNAGVSSLKPNVVNIGALYTFNSVIGRSAKPAIESAVDDVNSDSTASELCEKFDANKNAFSDVFKTLLKLKFPAVNRRIRKFFSSKYWKVTPKLKDEEHFNADSEIKPVYHNRKICYKHRRSQRDYPFKKRRLYDRSSVSNFEGISSEGISSSPRKGFSCDASGSSATPRGASGISACVAGQHTSFQSRDSYVKLRIKSFKVPELVIEIPESATVGSLKRTVMDAVTAILGGGLRVGVLQGKKIRDDNKTLLQTGICHNNKLDALGFSLEPNPSHAPQSLCHEDRPFLLACDTPQPLTRYPPAPSVVHNVVQQRTADTLPDPPLSSLGNFIESDHDLAPSPPDMSIDKSPTHSRALVAVPAMNVEALAVVPMRKSKRSPFSVYEVEALVQAVEKLGTGRWREVKLRAFDNAKHRTYVDLKDKWKTLVHTARISPQQRRDEPVPQELLDRVLTAHAYWSQQEAKQQLKQQHSETCRL